MSAPDAASDGLTGQCGPDPAAGPHSLLHATLRRGRFAVTAEIGPPRSATVEPIPNTITDSSFR